MNLLFKFSTKVSLVVLLFVCVSNNSFGQSTSQVKKQSDPKTAKAAKQTNVKDNKKTATDASVKTSTTNENKEGMQTMNPNITVESTRKQERIKP